MARITGKNGTVKVGTTTVANISDWSLDAKLPTADATAMGDAFATKLSLIREWSGQIKGIYGNAAEAIDLLNSFINGTTSGGATSGTVTLHLMPDSAGTEDFYGSAYCDFALGVAKDKANEFTAKFVGTGTLSHTP